jgi:hypothetical protein
LPKQGPHNYGRPCVDECNRIGALLGLGRYDEAGDLLRGELKRGDVDAGEFRTPPVAESPYVEDQLAVGTIRLMRGEREAGIYLLQEGARRAAARPPGAGTFARRWHDVAALALLGRHAEACAAFRASVAAGLFTGYDFAEHIPALASFRAQPCYAPVVASAKARADAEIAKARAAGLLEG